MKYYSWIDMKIYLPSTTNTKVTECNNCTDLCEKTQTIIGSYYATQQWLLVCNQHDDITVSVKHIYI